MESKRRQMAGGRAPESSTNRFPFNRMKVNAGLPRLWCTTCNSQQRQDGQFAESRANDQRGTLAEEMRAAFKSVRQVGVGQASKQTKRRGEQL
jgi:hypothetical protein